MTQSSPLNPGLSTYLSIRQGTNNGHFFFKHHIMENPQIFLESLITNPGLQHLGHKILRHLNKKTLLSLRIVNHSCKNFVENSRLMLKKLNFNVAHCAQYSTMELHQAWLLLIQKVDEKNPDLEENIALNLIKLIKSKTKRIFPLNVISQFGDIYLVKFIIEHNMVGRLSGNCENGGTPIYHATLKGHTEIVKILIGCTNNPNAPNILGETPILRATYEGYSDIVKVLIECSDNPNAPDEFGRTPYQIATLNKNLEIMNLLKPKTFNWLNIGLRKAWLLIWLYGFFIFFSCIFAYLRNEYFNN